MNLSLIDSLDVSLLLKEVMDNYEQFGTVPFRTSATDSPHREATDILLRGPSFQAGSTHEGLWNEKQCIDYSTFDLFPEIYEHVLDLMRAVNGTQLGRVIITSLKPDKRIYPHADKGIAGDFYTRYHTVLQGTQGNVFTSGDDTQDMITNQVWYINNHIEHSAHNNTQLERIHIICDIET